MYMSYTDFVNPEIRLGRVFVYLVSYQQINDNHSYINYTNITIYEMRHFTLIRKLLTMFYRLFISLQAYLGERPCCSSIKYCQRR